jgi:CBS domain containing-hemolysin-like protein
MTFVGILLLIGITLITISLQRTYGSIPQKELRKRARNGDVVAAALFKAAAYGSSLKALLWALVIGFSSLLFVVVSRETATWFALLTIALTLWFGFVWLPAHEATRLSMWLARQLAPALAKLLAYIHPVLRKPTDFIARHRPVNVHTGLYDKEDLKELFARQRVQFDNRVDQQTLEIVEQALSFGDKKVSDILTPRRVVKAVAATDSIGPVLMDDLHKSGHSRFPVYEGKQDNIVGVLFLREAVRAKAGGSIQKVMNTQVCYVHEDQPLTEALHAILKTHQQLFIVVNSFEEYVGIVTIEDIMEAIVGKQIVDEFDEYEDLRAVAAKTAAKEHKEHIVNDSPHENIQEVTEVVE